MARRKLTLSVDEEAVQRGRWFSKKHHTSISRLVSEFLLLSLGAAEVPETPIVSRLVGILPPDTRVEEYHEHLVKKYDP